MAFKALDQFLELMPQRGIPAMEVVVSHGGESVYHGCAGFSDSADTKRVTPKDLYWIFSATKPITCVAAMRLVERGLLNLNDPVSKYLPAFTNMTVRQKDGSVLPCETPMTIEHLFTMQGGMDYNLNSEPMKEAKRNPHVGTLEMVNAMAKNPLFFEPGTNYRYSLCHDVLAAVIEVVSGMSFGEYLRTNIFDPLEMEEIGFRPNEEQKQRFSALYRFNNAEGSSLEIPIQNNYNFSDCYESGGAGLFTNADTYITFLSALSLNGTAKNGYELLRPETVKLLQENHLSGESWKTFVTTRLHGYGWGLCGRVHLDPVYSMSRSGVGEFGWDGAAGAFALADPAKQVGLYVAMHSMGCNYAYHRLHYAIRDLAYECLGL